ncbi:MAG: ATP-binding protein [Myxococcota bacterium]
MQKFFNISGPCVSDKHYMLPALVRLPDPISLIEQEQYFVLHAARQTGKSTAMIALAKLLRERGYAAVYASLEASQGFAAVEGAESLWLAALSRRAGEQLPQLDVPSTQHVTRGTVGDRLRAWLTAFSQIAAPMPAVVLFDEVDVIEGAPLISLLRQLREGFTGRAPGVFPSSIALIGMRDLRDYLAYAKDGSPVNPGSPFNIKTASLTLRNFTGQEVADLYQQHTDETGQRFTPEASARAYWWSQGQPFLVNALARICTQQLLTDHTLPVTAFDIDRAKEALIFARTTHLDSLAERLREARVARIVEPVITGDKPFSIPYDHDDFEYVVDLGLIVRGPQGAEPANPIYREVLARQLSYNVQMATPAPWWRWQTEDGRLDFPALVDAFLDWWRENEAAIITQGDRTYPEAMPHLTFMAFLQRVVNGGGTVLREYAAGRGAVDLLITYGEDRFVVELKRVAAGVQGMDKAKDRGSQQLADYLDTLGEEEGWLIIFDQRTSSTWDDRLWRENRIVDGRTIHLCGA